MSNVIIPFKGRTVDLESPVYIYRCLNRKGRVFSIKQKDKVVAHTNELAIKDVEFIIHQAAKKRVLQTGERNVHAFIKGKICNLKQKYQVYPVKYNPYKDDTFFCNDKPIIYADCAIVTNTGVLAPEQVLR